MGATAQSVVIDISDIKFLMFKAKKAGSYQVLGFGLLARALEEQLLLSS